MGETTETFAINVHSQTDLITNSSTTIYTFSENSPKAMKEMVNEFFKAFGIDHKCEDIFSMVVLSEYIDDMLEDYIRNICEFDEDEDDNDDTPLYDEEDTDSDSGEISASDIPKKYRNPKTMSKELDKLVKNIKSGKEEAPDWFSKIVDDMSDRDNPNGGTIMYITAKDPKHNKLAKAVSDFLYSTESEECAD